VSADHEIFLGVDVGGTKVAVAAIAGGEANEHSLRPTDTSSSEALLEGIEQAVAAVIEQTGAPTAIGVGVPSQVEFATGTVITSTNVPLEGIELRGELERRLGAPVYVDNDANCAALAEAHSCEGGPVSELVMYTLGTGVGGGIVIGGRIYRGATGLGAELGHAVVQADGPSCPGRCPSRGCLEALCSGTALARDGSELARDDPGSTLGRLAAEQGEVKGSDVVDAARAGDPGARELMQRLGRWLGVGLAGAANSFEPQLIVIGGGLSNGADQFLEAARAEAGARALPAIWERVSLAIAGAGPEAGVIGAGTLALQEHRASVDTAR